MSETKKGIRAYLASHLREYGLLLALLAIMAFFQIMTGGVMLKSVNITNLFLQNSYIIMALGMLVVIVADHIDLSVGSVMGFIGALAAVMIVQWELPLWLAIPICLFFGALIGAAQGYWVAYWSIPTFIVTLAGMLVFRGLSLWLLEGQSVGPFPKEFQALSTGFIPDFFPEGVSNSIADFFGLRRFNGSTLASGIIAAAVIVWLGLRGRARDKSYGIEGEPRSFFIARNAIVAAALLFVCFKLSTFRGLPNVLITMTVLTVIYTFITEKTTIGRRVYAVGGNEKAAELSGIKTKRLTFIAFTNMGMLAALAGLIFAARLNTATPRRVLPFNLT